MRLTPVNAVLLASAIVVASGVAIVACTSTDRSDPIEPTATLADGESGIIGTMIATGGRAGTPDSPAAGQVLIWPAADVDSSPASGAFPRPLEAIATTGQFAVELEPGSYVVRGTELLASSAAKSPSRSRQTR
jgi:hypothetical protein